MAMGPETRNGCAGEGQQQITALLCLSTRYSSAIHENQIQWGMKNHQESIYTYVYR
jgi:hypothetical protein